MKCIHREYLEDGIRDQGLGVADAASDQDTRELRARRHNYATRRQVDEVDTDAGAA